MAILFIILFLISIICLILGIIRPSLVIKWGGENKKTRKKVFKYFGTALAVLFILILITAPKVQTQPTQVQPKQEEIVEETVENIDNNKEKEVKAEELKEVKKLGWTQENENWYYYDNDGKPKTGWVKENNKSYYFNTSGIMQKGWIKDNGKDYYCDNSGVMQTGWKESNSKWYYLNSNGTMATSTTVDGYQVSADGVMQEKTVVSEPIVTQEDTSKKTITTTKNNNTANTANEQGQTVYITATGKKYHSIPKCGNTKSSRPATLKEAEQLGLSACSKCH